MRIAVFSDIHGNPYALDAVLEAIKNDGTFDHLVAAGDLAFGGSDPVYCIDRIQEANVLAVYGNTEVYIHSPEITPGDQLHLKKWDRLKTDAHWIRKKIGTERIEYLRSLPFELTFSPTNNPQDNLLVFHANPLTIEEMIFPPAENQIALFGKVIQPDNDPELNRLFRQVSARTIAFGHFHYTSIREWQNFKLVNVAPVSMPAKDKDPRARYSVFKWNNDTWEITQNHIAYDYTQELTSLSNSGLPHWKDHASTFVR